MEGKCNPSCEFKDFRFDQEKDRDSSTAQISTEVLGQAARGEVLHSRTCGDKWHRAPTKKGKKVWGLPEKRGIREGLMYLGNGIQQQVGSVWVREL